MILCLDVYNALTDHASLAGVLSTLGLGVFGCLTFKKVLAGGSRVCAALARAILRGATIAIMFLTMFGSVLNASYSNHGAQVVAAAGDSMERALFTVLSYYMIKNGIAQIPKFLLFIKNPLNIVLRLGEFCRVRRCKEEQVPGFVFASPSLVLLQ